jgi:ParB-like nuclease domain
MSERMAKRENSAGTKGPVAEQHVEQRGEVNPVAVLDSMWGKPVEKWPLSKLVTYEKNPRKHSPEKVAQFAGAIREFGWRYPVLAKSTGELIDGHFRLKVAEHLQLKEVPVICCDDMTDQQIRAFRLSVNRMAELAEWHQDHLLEELEDLKAEGVELDPFGAVGFGLEQVDEAIDVGAWDLSPTQDKFVITITGSLPLAGEVRARLKDLPGEVTIEASTLQRE